MRKGPPVGAVGWGSIKWAVRPLVLCPLAFAMCRIHWRGNNFMNVQFLFAIKCVFHQICTDTRGLENGW